MVCIHHNQVAHTVWVFAALNQRNLPFVLISSWPITKEIRRRHSDDPHTNWRLPLPFDINCHCQFDSSVLFAVLSVEINMHENTDVGKYEVENGISSTYIHHPFSDSVWSSMVEKFGVRKLPIECVPFYRYANKNLNFRHFSFIKIVKFVFFCSFNAAPWQFSLLSPSVFGSG